MGDVSNPKEYTQVVGDLNICFSETDQFASVFNSGTLTWTDERNFNRVERNELETALTSTVSWKIVTEFNDTSVLETSQSLAKDTYKIKFKIKSSWPDAKLNNTQANDCPRRK